MTPVPVAAATFVSRHATHLAAVAIPVAMIVVALVADSIHSRRKRRRAEGRDAAAKPRLHGQASVALRVAAAASIGAAVVHLRVLPDHAAESAWYGAFFAAAALGQIGGAALLVRDVSRRLVALFAAGNAAVIALWLFTRLVAIPLGPASGSTESFGALDVLASTLEAVVAVACACALWPRRAGIRATPARHWDAVTIPVITVATIAFCVTARVG